MNNKNSISTQKFSNHSTEDIDSILDICIQKLELLSLDDSQQTEKDDNLALNFSIDDFIIDTIEWFYDEEDLSHDLFSVYDEDWLNRHIQDKFGLFYTPEEVKNELEWFKNYGIFEPFDKNDLFGRKSDEYYSHLENELNIYNACMNSGNVTIRRKKLSEEDEERKKLYKYLLIK